MHLRAVGYLLDKSFSFHLHCIDSDMDEQFAASLRRQAYRMPCLKDIDHFSVARRKDPAVGGLYRNCRAEHLRCECLVAHLRERNDFSVYRASQCFFFHFCLCLLSSLSFSCRRDRRLRAVCSFCRCLRSLVLIEYKGDRKRHAYRDQHLDDILHRAVQAEKDTEDTCNACSLSSKMYDRRIQSSASAADTSCDERFEES